MRRLVIDDEREFAFDAVYARNSDEALWLLTLRESFDEVWFDWDLGGDDCAIRVLPLIERSAMHDDPLPVGLYVIHTGNPVGRATLERTFKRWSLPYKHIYLSGKDFIEHLPQRGA